jgi:hypothetical protein
MRAPTEGAAMIKRPNWDSSEWEPPHGRRPRPPTLREYEAHLLGVFRAIERSYGLETARKVFANFVREPNKTQLKDREAFDLISRLNSMTKPNAAKLVRDLLAQDGIDPEHKDYDKETARLTKAIQRGKERWPSLKAGFGAVSPPLKHDEPASFVFHGKKRTNGGCRLSMGKRSPS